MNEFTNARWAALTHEERVALLTEFGFEAFRLLDFDELPYVVRRTLTYHGLGVVNAFQHIHPLA